MDSRDTSPLDKMTESAGEVLFKASAQNPPTSRGTIKELAHHLGRLYGETIRACRGYDGLKDEVQTTFMCGMAISPNFGREEVLRDSGAEAREEKTPGQLLFEKEASECGEGYNVTWGMLREQDRKDYEQEAVTRAKATKNKSVPGVIRITEEEMHDPKAEEYRAMSRSLYAGGLGLKVKDKAAMEAILDAPVGAPLPKDSPFATIDWDKDEEVQAKAAKPCSKCTGTGNMSQLGEYEKCDAC